jgi:hypothetical protein
MFGSPIHFESRPHLTAYRGKLLSGADVGTPVHAGAFIRQRIVILESSLFAYIDRLRLILTHELFHFVWVRLSNEKRREFAGLLAEELRRGARGETGESAGIKKRLVRSRWPIDQQSPLWRDYVCESFCDSGAACFSPAAVNDHFTLAASWAKCRYEWLMRTGGQGWRC